MRIVCAGQLDPVGELVAAKHRMLVPILEALLKSLSRDRLERLGGVDQFTLHDLAREFREGHGDTGICFEYAVHEAIANADAALHPLVCEVLHDHCKIDGAAESIFFGPEKDGVIPIAQTAQDALTENSTLLVGSPGRPPKLRQHIPTIVDVFFKRAAADSLPASIRGVWKADLFLGTKDVDQWVGTSVKYNPAQLEGAAGLRIGLYPGRTDRDVPRKDTALNLIRCPLPYDEEFMALFHQAFVMVRLFLLADAREPRANVLPYQEDRLIARELAARRTEKVVGVMDEYKQKGQDGLLAETAVIDRGADLLLSEATGLSPAGTPDRSDGLITLVPSPRIIG